RLRARRQRPLTLRVRGESRGEALRALLGEAALVWEASAAAAVCALLRCARLPLALSIVFDAFAVAPPMRSAANGVPLLLRALRADAGGPAAPALVVCSGDNVELAGGIDTRDLADARLVKPVDLGALVQTLAALGVHPAGGGGG
ncbi:MAG: hypothetical protein JNG88_19565, partial [Phycisphaerales bacterium]|nr:hypothetical protein [Phycisphaerales bacterium]